MNLAEEWKVPEDLQHIIEDEEDDLYVTASSGMKDDMQSIDAIIGIESVKGDRHVLIVVTWKANNLKEPSSIHVQYEPCSQHQFRNILNDAILNFGDKLNEGGYCRRDLELGLLRYKGFQNLSNPRRNFKEAILTTLGRHAHIIVDFLNGGDDYKKLDLTYSNLWGAW